MPGFSPTGLDWRILFTENWTWPAVYYVLGSIKKLISSRGSLVLKLNEDFLGAIPNGSTLPLLAVMMISAMTLMAWMSWGLALPGMPREF